MTTPSNKMALLVGSKDRPGDPTQINVPPRGLPTGGTTDITDLDARILQVIEDALAAAGSGTPLVASPYDGEALKQLLGYLGGVEVAGSTRPNQTPTVDDVRRYFATRVLGAVSPQLGVIVDRASAQETRIKSLEAAGASNSLAIFGVADTAWTACTMNARVTSGVLWVRVWKGHVIFKANNSKTDSTGSGWSLSTGRITDTTYPSPMATLPASIIPPFDMKMPVATYQQGSAPYGAGVFHLYRQSGTVSVSPGSAAMDGFYADGLSYPVGAW